MMHAVDPVDLLVSLEERVWSLRRRLNEVDRYVVAETVEDRALKRWLRAVGDLTSLVLVDLEQLRNARGSSWQVIDHAFESACRKAVAQLNAME